MTADPTDSCADPAQKLLSVEEGRERILASIQPLSGSERLDLRSALGRVLAGPAVSRIDVPGFDNSAMDGYAVRSADFSGRARGEAPITGSSLAGKPFNGILGEAQCVRIMTGAVMPEGADAVIMQEHVELDGDRVRFEPERLAPGLNVRYAGEDIREGDTVIKAGVKLGAAEIGLLASTGVAELRVTRAIRAVFFSTGDELSSVGMPLARGQIYDSNRYTLFGMLARAGVEALDLGVIPDRRDAVRSALREAGEVADLVLTSGGVSVGEADYVTDVLGELGEISFWRMAVKPGKPLAFGRVGKAVFFGLPGNPVSVMATFYQFVLPAVRKMAGEPAREAFLLRARCADVLEKAPGRMEFQRGILEPDAEGGWRVSTAGRQGSHLLSTMSRANCFIHLAADSSGSKVGDMVTVQPFLDFCG
jgi:molybdopterin molybdotransferase